MLEATNITDKKWEEHQSMHYLKQWKVHSSSGRDFVVKAEVKRDSYDYQSYAVGYIFDPEHGKWNTICTIPYPQMQSMNANPYAPKAELKWGLLKDDAEQILSDAMLILESSM